DLPSTVEDARAKLRAFVDEVMSNAPPLPSHINHSQWEYHWADFQDARRLPSRIRSWGKTRLQHAATTATGAALRVKRKALEMCKPFVRVVGESYVTPPALQASPTPLPHCKPDEERLKVASLSHASWERGTSGPRSTGLDWRS